jgi:hypothetical protein
VPEEWYRRPKSKSYPSHLSHIGEDTLKFVSSDESSPLSGDEDPEDNGDGTAKQSSKHLPSMPSSPDLSKSRRFSSMSNSSGAESPSRRSTFSAHRLSSMFDSWLSLSPSSAAMLPSQPNAGPERISVSSPLPIDPRSIQDGDEEQVDLVETEEQRAEFEQFMVFIIAKPCLLALFN